MEFSLRLVNACEQLHMDLPNNKQDVGHLTNNINKQLVMDLQGGEWLRCVKKSDAPRGLLDRLCRSGTAGRKTA